MKPPRPPDKPLHPLVAKLAAFGLSSQQVVYRLFPAGPASRVTVDRWRRGETEPQVRYHVPLQRLITQLELQAKLQAKYKRGLRKSGKTTGDARPQKPAAPAASSDPTTTGSTTAVPSPSSISPSHDSSITETLES